MSETNTPPLCQVCGSRLDNLEKDVTGLQALGRDNRAYILKLVEAIRRLGTCIDLDTTTILADVGLVTQQRSHHLVGYNNRGQALVVHENTLHEVFLSADKKRLVFGPEVDEKLIAGYYDAGLMQKIDMWLSVEEICEWLERKLGS